MDGVDGVGRIDGWDANKCVFEKKGDRQVENLEGRGREREDVALKGNSKATQKKEKKRAKPKSPS